MMNSQQLDRLLRIFGFLHTFGTEVREIRTFSGTIFEKGRCNRQTKLGTLVIKVSLLRTSEFVIFYVYTE